MFDWLRKAAQGVGNFIYNSTPAGGALRTVNRTINRRDPRLQQQQQVQQRQVPQAPPPPRINLPKINLNQANSILNKLSNPFTIPVGNVVDKTIKGVNDLTQPQIRGVKNFVKPNPMGIKSIGFEPTVKDINTGQVVANPPSVGKRAQIEPRIAGVGRRAAMPVNNKSPVDNFLSGLNMAFRQATGQKLASDQEALLRRSPQANAYFKFMPRPEETANAFISMNPIWSTARDVKNQGLKAFEFQNVLRRNNPLQGFADINSRIQRDTVKDPFIQANSQQGFNKKVLELNTRASDNSKQFISDVLNKVVVQGGANLPGVKQVRQTTPGKFVGENIADPMLKFYIDTLARVGGTGTGQKDAYAGGIQGWGQGLTDITNVGSLAYTGAKAGQLAAAPLTQALKLAPGVFGRQALANSGANVLNQFAEGKKYNQIDPIQVAGAGILGGALGTGIPLGGKILGKGISKVLGRGAANVDLNAPITVKTYVEKGKLLEQGYKNVKIKFNGATHKIQNDGVVTELAPKGIKGVKIDKSTQEAVDAGALSPKLAQQGYKVTPDLEIIAPNGKKLSIGEIQQLEQASALTKAEQKIAQGQETYGEAEALTKQLGKQPARIADDFNQPRSPNGRYGSKEFNPELEQLKAYQTEQLQVLQRANQSSPEYRGAMDNYNVAQKRIDVLEQPKVTADTSTTLYETVPKGTFDKRPKGKIEEARSYIENALAKNLKQYHKEFGGVAKLARESDVGGGMDYSRQSMNPKWYRKFYEDNGRAPTKQDYLEIARSELKKGSPDARAMLGDDVVDTYVRSFEPPKPNRVYKQPKNVEKKRGFVQTVQDSEFTEQPTRVMLDQSDTFTTKSNKLLEKKANEMITADVTNARAYAMNNTDDQAVATAGQLIKYYQAKNDFGAAAQIADDVAHRLTEAGRTIQAASLYNKLNPEGILQYASSKVQKAGKTLDPQAAEVLTDLAKKIEKMADGEDKQLAIKEMMDIIGRAKGSAISDKVITLWKSGLLTSPVTTAGNLTSNTFKQIVKKASDDPIAAVTDMMFSVVTGKRTKTFTGRGLLGGAGEGSVRGIKYFKTGYDIRNPIDKLDSKQVYFSDSWAGKVAQTYSDSVFRLMGAQDQPYFYAALRNTLYDQALAAAKNQGVKGQARDQFIKKFVNNTPSDIMDVATEEARQAVFQNKTMLSSIASKINQSDNTAVRALGQFLMPFSKVPSAVATEIFDRTPLGAAKEIVKQVAKRKFDQRAMSNAIAKSTTGTVGIMGLGYALDRGDSINLAFPQSETERNLWELEGRQPFSVKVGDKWVSLNYVQPFGSLIAMGAQYHRSLKDGGGVQDALASSAAMGAKAVTEQSFLRGVGGALGALQDPARQAERYVEQTAGSVIPNFIRTTARATDPVQRQINNAGEAVIAGVPGLRQTLLPKQNVFGQEIARADSPLGTMINPFRPTTAKSDPTIEELRRLYDTKNGVLPSELDKSAFGKDKQITPAQINELQASVGQPVLERWQKIMADYRYKRLSDEDKAKVLKDARDAVSRGEKYAFAQDNGLGDTKLDKDSVRYLEGNDKDYLARDLPKRKSAQASSKPKRVAKAKKGRKAKVGRIAKSSAPKLRSIKLSAGKVPKISRTAKVKFRRYA